MPAHERLRQLADELERSAGQDDVNGTADDLPEGAALDNDGDGAPDGGADLDGDGSPDPTDPAAQGGGQPGGDADPTDPAAQGGDAPGSGGAPGAGGEDGDSAASAFGQHNVEPGHHVAFQAGEFAGAGKVTATGEDGCTVQDKTGREHRVHWHEVKGHNDGAARAGAAQPGKAGGMPNEA